MGQELWGHRQTFHFGPGTMRESTRFSVCVFSKTVSLETGSVDEQYDPDEIAISPKWDLNTETAQLRRLPQVLHAMNAQYAQQNWNASSSATRKLDSVSCTADGECGCESARSPSACQLPC